MMFVRFIVVYVSVKAFYCMLHGMSDVIRAFCRNALFRRICVSVQPYL